MVDKTSTNAEVRYEGRTAKEVLSFNFSTRTL